MSTREIVFKSILRCFEKIQDEVGEGSFDRPENVMDAIKELYMDARMNTHHWHYIQQALDVINVDVYWKEKRAAEEIKETLRQVESFNNYIENTK